MIIAYALLKFLMPMILQKIIFHMLKEEAVDLASNPYHDKQRADCFMYSFVDSQEDEFTNQFVVKQVDVPSLLLLDDIAHVVDFLVYDKYEDDCDVEDVIFL
jgi:hypothetical protein